MTAIAAAEEAPSTGIPNQRESTESAPSQTPSQTPSPAGRLLVLDGLRLVAALMVVVWQYVAANASEA
jgi:hypothetical protein